MKILFIHQNFPGQYLHQIQWMIKHGWEVRALGMHDRPIPPGIDRTLYRPQHSSTPKIHPWVSDYETKIIRGEACARAALDLKNNGFTPDIICGHIGWGETLFIKEVWPDCPILGFLEFFYRTQGFDVGFDPEFQNQDDFSRACRLNAKNAGTHLAWEGLDHGISPTAYQASSFPDHWQKDISIIHDGINTDYCAPDPYVTLDLSRGGKLTRKDEIITFINRNLEPYRGFHSFMRALPKILRDRPNARVMMVGGDDISYGRLPDGGKSWREVMMQEVGDQLDMSRIHFLGKIPYAHFVRLMQISSVHVYLTYPFVLSWSTLEAMSTGALVIGSDTQPVREVIKDGHNGLLVDFFDYDAIAARVSEVLDHPDRMEKLRKRARKTIVKNYDLKSICLPHHIELIKKVARGEIGKTKP